MEDRTRLTSNSRYEEFVESYTLLAREEEEDSNPHERDKTFIVKRVSISFDDKECQVLNFRDITPFKQLKQEKETSHLLASLSTSVHHEMIGPLRINVQFAE